jgi:hypothetical protein
VRIVAPTGEAPAGIPRRLQLFRRSQIGFRYFNPIFGTRNLAFVALYQSLVHSTSSTIPQTMASVVNMREAMEAAFCRVVRVTLVGSITPAFTRSSYF